MTPQVVISCHCTERRALTILLGMSSDGAPDPTTRATGVLAATSLAERLIQRGSPFELQDTCVGGVPCKVFPRGPQTLRALYRRAESFGDKPFLVCGEARRSFGELSSDARRWRQVIARRVALGGGTRAGLFLNNGVDWVKAFVALTSANATVALLHADTDARVALKALAAAGCDVVLTDARRAAALRALGARLPLLACDTEIAAAEAEHEEGSASEPPLTDPDPDALALIAFTSGTTGAPKGVQLTHRNLMTGMMNMMLGAALERARAPRQAAAARARPAALPPCSLLLSPLSHIGGFSQVFLMQHLAGKLVLMPSWRASDALELVAREKVRSLCGASPTMLRELLRSLNGSCDTSSLVSLNINGQALHAPLLQDIAEALPQVRIGAGYGMTETCGSIASTSLDTALADPAACGPVLPSVELCIVDPAGRALAPGMRGEIWIRGAMVTGDYCTSAGSAAAARKSGWLETGDLGRVDETGHLFIEGRGEDRVPSARGLLSYTEVEEVVLGGGGVDEAAVTRRADGSVIAAVVPRETPASSTPSRLPPSTWARVAATLEGQGIRAEILLLAALPRTASGKVDREAVARCGAAVRSAEA